MMRGMTGRIGGWIALGTLTAASAMAQSPADQDLLQRLNRLERDTQQLQQEVYQDAGQEAIAPRPDFSGTGAGSAQAQAYIAQLEEQLRIMTGRMEELEYKVRTLDSKFRAIEKDLDLRLGAIERQVNAGDTPRLQSETTSAGGDPAVYRPDPSTEPAPSGPTTGTPRDLSEPPASDDPRTVYNHAFKLLNQAKFADAGQAFEAFTKQYPKDPLVGNAYYWMGETHYVRRDFLKAADSFRIGFQAMPEGPKAPDNLLKLGMSLSNLGKTQEACVVYGQLLSKFPNASTSLKQKTEQERSALGCQ